MGTLDSLIACAGRWVGTNRLQDPHTRAPEESPATATIASILGGRFVRLDYTWSYQGTPQEGSILIGHDQGSHEATAHWIDTWHMNDRVMACRGQVGSDGQLSVRGSYSAPPGPDWGWRTTIAPKGQALHIVMYNIAPDGREELAVEMEYRRG